MTQSGELAHEQRQEPPAAKSSALSLPPTTSNVTSFRVHVPQRAVRDLHSRIRNARWPEKELAPDWSQGVPLSDARDFVEYWASSYDWRRLEAEINSFGNYRTQLDGIGIHFIHAESPHANALPLILTHGWPGSIVEFLDCIGPLVNPVRYGGSAKDAFHVIIPSLPGFGFSDRPGERGWNYTRIARTWVELMNRLGYGERWVAQGGDWGSAVVHVLAILKPAGLRAVHTNWPQVVPMRKPDQMTPEEQKAWAQVEEFQTINNGYWREQATRPQTLGYALTDSPIGLATWILEKFQAWTDNSGEPQDALSNDRMLDNISLYWFTETITSSMRLYMECAPAGPGPFNAGRIDFPIAASIFPREIFKAPRSWADRLWPNIVYWNEVDRGGHFAAMEQPDIFVNEVRNAFRTHRDR